MSRPAAAQGAIRPRRRRRRLRLWVPLVLLVVLSPAIYSWTRMATLPSSLPLGVRSVEWLRQHHFNWLVDNAEHVYYSWQTPAKGGPQLKTLPTVGVGGKRKSHARVAAPWPPRIRPVFANPLPGEGVWKPSGPRVAGGPPVLVTTFRTERDYPRIVAYVAWFDHKRTAVAYYPGRYEPPSATLRGPMQVPFGQRWRLLATFNSGFIYSDGLNGDALNGQVNEPLKDGLATVVAYRNGGVDIVTGTVASIAGPGDRFRAPEPAADHRPRAAQPRARQQHQVGLHPGECSTCLAHRARDRSPGEPHLRRRGLPDRDHARPDPQARGCGAGDGARHQPRVADLEHVPAPARDRPDDGRAELPAGADALPRARRPRLLRRLPAPAGADYRSAQVGLR